MIVRVGETVYSGRAVQLESPLEPETVASAVREGRAVADGTIVEVVAREAGPLHERVGCLTPTMTIRPRTALAAAARSLDWSTPVDDRLAVARDRLEAHHIETDPPDTTEYRRRVAEAGADVDRLREQVAETRGRVRAATGEGRPAERGEAAGGAEAAEALEAAVRSLSEEETTAAAAREAHRAARASARETRDRLQERLRLEDEVANLERRARAHLTERARPAYEAALAAVPGTPDDAEPFDAAPDAMALAVARVGELAAPVVLATERFPSAAVASRWLGAPVVRI